MKIRWCTLVDWENYTKTVTLQYWNETHWEDIPSFEYDNKKYDCHDDPPLLNRERLGDIH